MILYYIYNYIIYNLCTPCQGPHKPPRQAAADCDSAGHWPGHHWLHHTAAVLSQAHQGNQNNRTNKQTNKRTNKVINFYCLSVEPTGQIYYFDLLIGHSAGNYEPLIVHCAREKSHSAH